MDHAPAHRLDEFPVSYSLTGCAPALPASASPTAFEYVVTSSCWSTVFQRTANSVLTICVSRGGKRKQIHIVLDNLSAHKTSAVQEFLAANPKVRFHFTPTYSSWLNQVELWFAKIQRDVIDRGVFTSVADLSRKIRKYSGIRQISQAVPLDVHRSQAPHQGNSMTETTY